MAFSAPATNTHPKTDYYVCETVSSIQTACIIRNKQLQEKYIDAKGKNAIYAFIRFKAS